MSDAISQQLLAERLLVTKGNVTGVVNRLAERGWVVRRDDPDDRRTNRIELTAEGRKLAKRALVIQRNLVDEMTAGLTKSEREELRTLLTRLASKIEEMEND
jgi:DNA-binding MarR family transcriptional regulator